MEEQRGSVVTRPALEWTVIQGNASLNCVFILSLNAPQSGDEQFVIQGGRKATKEPAHIVSESDREC